MVSDVEYLSVQKIARKLELSEQQTRTRLLRAGLEPVSFGGNQKFYRRSEVEKRVYPDPEANTRKYRRQRAAA